MTLNLLPALLLCVTVVKAVQYPVNPTSDISEEERNFVKDKKNAEDISGHEMDTEFDDRDKKFLDDAMKAVLDPDAILHKNSGFVDSFKNHLDHIIKENVTVEVFMDEMDNLSLEVCKTSQEALWSYVTDAISEGKKNEMVRIAAEDDEIKKIYWDVVKSHYLKKSALNHPNLTRKFRIIKERSLSVLKPRSQVKQNIDVMQSIWSHVGVCAYNTSTDYCNETGTSRTLNDVLSIFKTSSNSEELLYYWKSFRDATGRKIRPVFKEYVSNINEVAKAEEFDDAGKMMRYAFEDDNFEQTVENLWADVKPLYNLIHEYTRYKLKMHYADELQNNDKLIPEHILGNVWAQEWQSIYPKISAYPEHRLPEVMGNEIVNSKQLFDVIDDFYQSIGFESAKDSYINISDSKASINCLPSSHDMCDGQNYKIKWCGGDVSDITLRFSRAARLLGHVQYFKQYRNLPPLYRDGPNPAFHDALSDIIAIDTSSPLFLQTLSFVRADITPQGMMNHLLWLSLEKIPLMAYAYVLDQWRWNIFANSSITEWNQYWWDLRIKETGISPPIPRDETDLDPLSKYHVVSHVQYITYFVSTVLEFQILRSLCNKVNHTGPLHKCSIYGVKEAGKSLRDGMSLGASEDWRTVLEVMTGEKKLSADGILEYFEPLQKFILERLNKAEDADMDQSVPMIVGSILVILVITVVIVYCIRKHNIGGSVLSLCGLSKNGSLDIATNDLGQNKNDAVIDMGVTEAKL